MTPASLLVALFVFAPPAEGAAEPPAPSVGDNSNDRAEYDAALARVREAQQLANEEPERGSVRLRDALQVLQGFSSQLAKDPEAQELRINAQLTLARTLLATEDADGAREVMDEAIRTSRGDPLPAKDFGPGLSALYKERGGVLEKQGRGSIEVTCQIACRVYINERPTAPRTEKLVPGRYRVWVEASDGSQAPVGHNLDIAEGSAETISYGTKPIADTGGNDDNDDNDDPPKAKRIMPRWAEVVLMSAGAAAIGTGAALWAIDGKCPGGADPNDTDACPQVYITKTAGIVTLAAGGAVLLTGTLLLTVDEVRVGKQRGTSAMLTYTLRF